MDTRRLARLRQGAYRFFSQALLYPDADRLSTLAAAALEIDRHRRAWDAFAFYPEWRRFIRSLKGVRSEDALPLQNEYLAAFQVGNSSPPCPIRESAYLGGDPSAVGWLLAQVEGEYAQMGLSPSQSEPPDHAATELEFMAFLCSREGELWESRSRAEAIGMLQREREFVRTHLARWFPEFSRRVSMVQAEGLFTSATQAAAAFLAHEEGLLEALLSRVSYEGVPAC